MDDQLADAYAATHLDIVGEGGRIVHVEPRPEGTQGAYPDGWNHAYVLSACNPWSIQLTDEENAARHQQLVEDVASIGTAVHAAVGRAADDAWAEVSLCLVDADWFAVRELGERYEQNAVFVWTPTYRAVRYLTEDREDRHGWAAVWGPAVG